MEYSKKVMDHFAKPRNVGEIEQASGVGEVGNPVCGDVMRFYIKVKDDILEEVKFKTFGCGAAIAVSSMISEMAIGKTVQDASLITNREVAQELGGLPKRKMHCSNLGADALQAAIKNYRDREAGLDVEKEVIPHHPDEDEAPRREATDNSCNCPYCETETKAEKPFCSSCGRELQNGE